MALPSNARVSISPDVLIRQIGGEAFLLDIKTERYFGLDDVGSRMVAVLSESDSLLQALEKLQGEYKVDPAILHQDLEHLISTLLEQGLIEATGY